MEPPPAAKKLKLQNGMAQQSAPVAGHIPAGHNNGPAQTRRQPGQHAAPVKAPRGQQETPAARQQSGKKRKQQVASPEHLVSGLQIRVHAMSCWQQLLCCGVQVHSKLPC